MQDDLFPAQLLSNDLKSCSYAPNVAYAARVSSVHSCSAGKLTSVVRAFFIAFRHFGIIKNRGEHEENLVTNESETDDTGIRNVEC